MRTLFSFITVLLVVAAVSRFNARAEVAFAPLATVNVTNGIFDWRLGFRKMAAKRVREGKYEDYATGPTECRETEELAGVVLCMSYRQLDMNRMFSRITVYSEGGTVPSRTVIPNFTGTAQKPKDGQAQLYENELRIGYMLTVGHDIPSVAMSEFFTKALDRCNAGERNYCLNTEEREFYDAVYLPLKTSGKPFVLIAFSVQSTWDYAAVVSHEILHAQYFLSETYRNVVDRFWNSTVSEEDRRVLVRTLDVDGGYNPHDAYVMRNEFQAYLLQVGKEDKTIDNCTLVTKHTPTSFYVSQAFSDRYRKPLIDRLTAAGVPPIQVH